MVDDTDLVTAVEAFLDEADAAYSEYENGYTDADAVLRRLEPEIERLRDAAGD
ncbi:hypothetical protein [Haloarcula litorea]|uniref:hypothetical protein n=1 Tax=Haloarcula litorea TaxID=3032579 RepID=UPI0023E7F046|nr:hypothetical protein [Halomicroarcula sp. GDY20]